MAKENSFDIVSKTDYAEVTNALNQTTKEISQRFDFKGSHATVEMQDKDLLLAAEDETKLRNMNDILRASW
jgi:hypothetical protein